MLQNHHYKTIKSSEHRPAVLIIQAHDAENFEFKYFRVPRHPDSYTDDAIILLNFIFTGLHGYQITLSLSTNKQRHRLLLLKTGIPVAPTHL